MKEARSGRLGALGISATVLDEGGQNRARHGLRAMRHREVRPRVLRWAMTVHQDTGLDFGTSGDLGTRFTNYEVERHRRDDDNQIPGSSQSAVRTPRIRNPPVVLVCKLLADSS
jgi:hypothetical protein